MQTIYYVSDPMCNEKENVDKDLKLKLKQVF